MEVAPAVSPDAPLLHPLCAIFRRYLKHQGLKFTPERAGILDAVLGQTGVFGPEHLLETLNHGRQSVSQATIYRTLKHLVEAGIVSEVLLEANQALYELTFGREPKGYLLCVQTHQVIEFSAPELSDIRKRICQEHGFEPLSHRFVIYGLSPQARQAAADPQAKERGRSKRRQ